MRVLFLVGALALLVASLPLRAEVVSVRTAAEGVALVLGALEEVRAKQAALPPPTSDSEKLLRMAELEQAPRLAMSRLDLGALGEAEKQVLWGKVWPEVSSVDQANQEQLLAMVPEQGWFPISVYGHDAAIAAFLIVQHSDETLWRRFLPAIEQMVKTGEADGQSFALMYDRLALSEGRPQRYGSQMSCKDGRYQVSEPVEDWSAIDELRASVGLSTLQENLERFAGRGC